MTVSTGTNSYQALVDSITGIDFGAYSVRGMSATLTPISGEDGLVRAVDGTLLDFTAPQFHKYSVSISCTDDEAPKLTNVWQGTAVTVTFLPGLGPSNNTDGSLQLNCMVDSWNTTRDDYGCASGWQLNLLEV